MTCLLVTRLSRFGRFHLPRSVIGLNCDITTRHSSDYKSEVSVGSLYPASPGPRVPDVSELAHTSDKFSGFIPMKEINISQGDTAVDLR